MVFADNVQVCGMADVPCLGVPRARSLVHCDGHPGYFQERVMPDGDVYVDARADHNVCSPLSGQTYPGAVGAEEFIAQLGRGGCASCKLVGTDGETLALPTASFAGVVWDLFDWPSRMNPNTAPGGGTDHLAMVEQPNRSSEWPLVWSNRALARSGEGFFVQWVELCSDRVDELHREPRDAFIETLRHFKNR